MIAVLAVLGLVGCTPRQDWRVEPCVGEDASTCRVGTLDVDGTERTYVVQPPPGYVCDGTSGESWPLLLLWHGSGDNGAGFRNDLTDLGFLDDWADDTLLVFPDGLERDVTDGYTGWLQDPDGEDVRFYDALLAELVASGCVDPEQVASFGHSRGGRFVHALACFRGDEQLGFGSAGAGRPDSWDCEDQAPVWLAHGVDDHEVPYRQGKAVRDHWARQDGCDDLPLFHRFERDACTPLDGCDEPVVFCPYEGTGWHGHAIPEFAGAEWRRFVR